ncbi:unnamed protein product [Phytomonas sp. Hart1]|nr:unnamed protein product [Phytomonas sp. Hart1]|eukprot:CCW65951.1 unnamed protein product [Phytomonas sp. isolate Hart1]
MNQSEMIGTPVDQMDISQMKSELTTLYGIKDFSQCLEVDDLRKRLSSVRDKSPITHGLEYGSLLRIGNTTNPTGLVTFSHGLGDSAHGWESAAYELASRLPHILFLLPTAPTQKVTINYGMSGTSWYDILNEIGSANAPHQQDAPGVLRSVDYLRSLAHVATRQFKIQSQRVVYAGFSQGAAISLATGLIGHFAASGVVCMSGYLPCADEVLPRIRNRETPIAMFHGLVDNIVPFELAKKTKHILQTEGQVTSQIDLFEYNMPHLAVPEELDEVCKFIARVLP